MQPLYFYSLTQDLFIGHAVDINHILTIQYFEATDGACVVFAALHGHFLNFFFCYLATNQFYNTGWHTNAVEEGFHGFDTCQCFKNPFIVTTFYMIIDTTKKLSSCELNFYLY